MGAGPRRWQRAAQRFAATRVGAWLCSRILHRVDRVLLSLSGGRLSTSRVFAGLRTIRLTTVGARTGEERTVPVVGIRDGEAWVVVASNWGDDGHPAWYYNLRANPEVTVTDRGRTAPYRAREVEGEERAEYWEQATSLYPGFEAYRRRTDREIPVVELMPAERGSSEVGGDR